MLGFLIIREDDVVQNGEKRLIVLLPFIVVEYRVHLVHLIHIKVLIYISNHQILSSF